ncbi:hypothetical protein SprV_0401691000 [Sparganum proliferum]
MTHILFTPLPPLKLQSGTLGDVVEEGKGNEDDERKLEDWTSKGEENDMMTAVFEEVEDEEDELVEEEEEEEEEEEGEGEEEDEGPSNKGFPRSDSHSSNLHAGRSRGRSL